jgi:hypothetical protein
MLREAQIARRSCAPRGFHCKTRSPQTTSKPVTRSPWETLPVRPIDPYQGLFDDKSMTTTVEFSAPRRSARIFRKLKVQAQGRAHNGKKFRETCQTLVVSAHGGLLMLKHEVDKDELLTITNPETQEEIECRIVFLGDLCAGGQRVGIEFLTPSPHFWGLEFSDQAPSGVESSAIH